MLDVFYGFFCAIFQDQNWANIILLKCFATLSQVKPSGGQSGENQVKQYRNIKYSGIQDLGKNLIDLGERIQDLGENIQDLSVSTQYLGDNIQYWGGSIKNLGESMHYLGESIQELGEGTQYLGGSIQHLDGIYKLQVRVYNI